MTVTVDFEGWREIEALMRGLADAPAVKRAGRGALREAAKPIIATAKRMSPKDVGNLEESIKQATAKRDRGDDGDQVAIVIGIDSSVQPPRYIGRKTGKGAYRDPGVAGVGPIKEFGTEHEPAHPFFRPAWDQHKDATPSRIAEALGPAIEKEAAKLAKRAGGA